MGRLDDKVAIITGAGAGMETVRMIRKSVGNSTFVKGDVSKREDWQELIRITVATYGKLNVLYNNAAVAIREPLIESTEEIFEKIISRHIIATALSYFFREFLARFQSVEKLFGDLEHPCGVSNFFDFLQRSKTEIEESLRNIVPLAMVTKVGISDGEWIQRIVGEDSRFALAEA